jgi:hypothetical protein
VPVRSYPIGVRCRITSPRDIMYVWSLLRDGALPWSARLESVADFLVVGCQPSIHSDLWFPGDRGLYWRALAQFLLRLR